MRKYIILVYIFSFLSCNESKVGKKNNLVDKPSILNLEIKANYLYDSENYNEAILLYSNLIKLDSANGLYYFRRGYSYAQMFLYNESCEDYKTAVKLNYRVKDSYLNLGLNYYNIDDSLSIYYFNKCMEIDSSNQIAIEYIEKISNKQKMKSI